MDEVRQPPIRYFTPEEANAELPNVRALMETALILSKKMRDLGENAPEKEVEAVKMEVLSTIAEISERGVEVKGLEAGLLDFPAMRNGKLVFLCWKIGEPKVEWWHPIHTGFRGRRRIENTGSAWNWRN